MRKHTEIVAAVALLAVVGAAVAVVKWQGAASRPAPASSPPAAEIRGAAPGFVLPDISGNRIDLARFAGKAVVINFFATWCPPCRAEIPGFVAVHRRYRDRGFEIVGISLDTDTRAHLPGFVSQNGIEYPILLGDVATARAYGVSPIPTTFFIGRDGRIRKVHEGYMDREIFDREVREIL